MNNRREFLHLMAKYRIDGKEVFAEYVDTKKGVCDLCGTEGPVAVFKVYRKGMCNYPADINDIDTSNYMYMSYCAFCTDEKIELIEEYYPLVLEDGSNRYAVLKQIPITEQQKQALQRVQVTTRYEALDRVANILGLRTIQRSTWATSRKGLMVNAYTTADISFSTKTGKIKAIKYTDHRENEICDVYASLVL